MPVVHFFFDVVSPYAYLAFHLLPQTLEGLACRVNYRPVVLGALLKAHGTPPPVQLPPKRDWIRRHTLWLAGQHGLPMRMPAVHPFRSLPWLRMALASSPHGLPSRYVCETLFQAIWEEGRDPDDADFQQEIWQAMTALLPEVRDPAGEAVKAELFALGEEALRLGVFGVPTFVLQTASAATGEGTDDHALFWGVDSLPMLRDALLACQPGADVPEVVA
ncbi:2-hydroxychromene-2-carboxylate isomerase [Brachymonas sp.]|uniref:2-hydroxychromene-2-carboxylate isomerase n=1 Tax=unclassified Brachymonas TaxID=2621329 RepID=UPI0035AFF910